MSSPIKPDGNWIMASSLHPRMWELLQELQGGKAPGVNYSMLKSGDLTIFEGWRNRLVQEAYYAQGRESLAEVNRLRKLAGLYQIGADQNSQIITNQRGTGSFHAWGLAVDLIYRGKWQSAEWWLSTGIPQWWESKGGTWGGRWDSPHDPAHFQLSLERPLMAVQSDGSVHPQWWTLTDDGKDQGSPWAILALLGLVAFFIFN